MAWPCSAAAWKSSTARLVLGGAAPGRVHDAEGALCAGVALVRRRLAELHRARLVLGDAAPVRVHDAEVALCGDLALVRRRLVSSTARASFLATPRPVAYMTPRKHCAWA